MLPCILGFNHKINTWKNIIVCITKWLSNEVSSKWTDYLADKQTDNLTS
jgi:hypothetical protein